MVTPEVEEAFADLPLRQAHMEQIVAAESAAAGFAPDLVREYLTRHIVHEFGPREYEGMELFLKYARARRAAAATCHANLTAVAASLY